MRRSYETCREEEHAEVGEVKDELGKDRAKKLSKLATAKGRRENDLLLLDSLPLVERGLELGLLVELFYDARRHQVLADQAEASGVEATPASEATLAKLARVVTSPGLVATARRRPPLDLAALVAKDELRLVFADALADPGNLGTVARSAAAFGFDGLIVGPRSADPESPKTLRASAGTLLSLPWLSADLGDLTEQLRGLTILRTVVRGGRDLADFAPPRRSVLWLGNEAQGVGEVPPGLSATDLTLPLSSNVESLNVAAAAAIFLHSLRASRSQ